jgi:branched-subunit amino acid transport protein
MSELGLILGMAAITFGIRYALFALPGKRGFPELFSRTLRFVPPAILSAIVLPIVLMPDGEKLRLDLGSPQLVGALVALVVGRLSGNLLAVIFSGMGTFWLWRFLASQSWFRI